MKNYFFPILLLLASKVYSQRIFPVFPPEQNFFYSDIGDGELEMPEASNEIWDAEAYNDHLLVCGKPFNFQNNSFRIGSWNGAFMQEFEPAIEEILVIYDLNISGDLILAFGIGEEPIQLFDGEVWNQINQEYFLKVHNAKIINGVVYACGAVSDGEYQLAMYIDGNWISIGQNLTGIIRDFELYNEEWIIAGEFENDLFGVSIRHIAVLSENSWIELDNGLNESCLDLIQYDDRLIVAGNFSSDGDNLNNIHLLAQYDSESIQQLEEYEYNAMDNHFGHMFIYDGKLHIMPHHIQITATQSVNQKLVVDNGQTQLFMPTFNRTSNLVTNILRLGKIIDFQDKSYIVGKFNIGRMGGLNFKNFGYYFDDQNFFENAENSTLYFEQFIGNPQFFDPIGLQHGMELPAGENKKTIWLSGLFMAGLNGSQVRFAANGNSPTLTVGPVSNQYNLSYLEKYARIWKLSKSEVIHHHENFNNSDYEIPEAILNWPAHGDLNLGEAYFMAPFEDLDGDLVYEPLDGEYPMIRGDQCLFFISSDNKSEISGNPEALNVDVRTWIYIYESKEEVLNHTVFAHYEIINRSGNNYSNFHIGQYTDIDIGTGHDDYVRSDPSLNYYFGYNGDFFDEESSHSDGYGTQIPSLGVVLLNRTLESAVYYYNSSNADTGDPQVATDYYNYLRGRWKLGTPIIPSGWGYPMTSTDTVETTTYMYSDYPWDIDGWSESSVSNAPGDRRMLGSTNIGSLLPNEEICFDVAFVSTFNNEEDGSLASLMDLPDDVLTIKNYYANSLESCDFTIVNIDEKQYEFGELLVYPNPSIGLFFISTSQTCEHLEVLSSDGRRVFLKINPATKEQLDLSFLSSGLYFLHVYSENQTFTKRLIIH